MMKQIPYGITDFSRIQKENYYYVDKTMFIEKIEMQPPYLFLIRPRRFGKSLTLAMLEAYYDVNHAEQFDELFGQLYIGQHPTKLHNQFLIMRFNFSEVSSNVNEVELSFKLHCCSKRLCQNADTAFFYAQSPDFLKPGLCYYPKFSYL